MTEKPRVAATTDEIFETAAPAPKNLRIRGAVVRGPMSWRPGDTLEIPVDRYWRGNVPAGSSGLVHDPALFPHVPNLVEYRLAIPAGGTFELEARYRTVANSPARLTLDGIPVADLFAAPADHSAAWSPLARLSIPAGEHTLRFTSRHVDTPFPAISSLRLVCRDAGPVAPPPERPTVGHRPSLPKDWHKTITRKIHSDFHTAGFIRNVGADFRPDEYADTLARSGVNAICVFAKCHHGYAYYNTRFGTRHPGLEFDLMQAQIDACHRRGIAVWVYFSVEFDELYASTLETPDGRPNTASARLIVDIETDYVRNVVWPMVAECTRGYDIDGVFFDFPGSEAFVQETIRRIKSIKPGVVVAYNHQWDKSRDELRRLDILEIESWEHRQTLYHWPYVARYARGVVPMTAMMIRFWKSWGDFGGLADEAMLRYEAATGLANGCALTIGDHLHPSGRLDAAVYDRIGRVLRRAAEIEPYVTDSESVAYVALLRQDERACAALLDAAVHFDVVDPTLPLDPYAAVVVPDGAAAGPEFARRLETYVAQGGSALLLGRLTPDLERLCGVRLLGDAEPSYVRIEPAALPSPPPTDLYTYEPVQLVEALPGTETVAPLVWTLEHGTPHRSRRQSPPHAAPSGHPAITQRTHGKGRVAYAAVPLLEIYAGWGCTAMRQILSDVLMRLIPPARRLAVADAPAPLELSLNRQAGRIIVHLVHCPQSRRTASSYRPGDLINTQPMVDGLTTVSGVRLRLASSLAAGKRIRMVGREGTLPAHTDDDGLVAVTVPDFQLHAVIVME